MYWLWIKQNSQLHLDSVIRNFQNAAQISISESRTVNKNKLLGR